MYPVLGVIVGSTTEQLLACVLLLYTSGIVHVSLDLDIALTLLPFAYVTLYVIDGFLYIPYKVILLEVIFKDDIVSVASDLVFQPRKV